MKIKLLILSFCLLQSCNLFAQKNIAHDKGWWLTGNIKSVIEIEHTKVDTTLKPNKIDMAVADTQYSKFDVKGNLIEDGWNINPAYSQVPPPNPVGKNIYKYDSTGQLIEELSYKSGDSLVKRSECEYDNKGNKTEMYTYQPDGNVQMKYIYTYDKEGNMLKKDGIDNHGTPTSEDDYEYDNNGNNIMAEGKNYTFGMSYKYVRTFDANGKCTEQDIYAKKDDKNYSWKGLSKWDEHGNMIEHNSFKFPDVPIGKETDTFVYDSHGNWIQRNEMDDGKPAKLTVRVIEYY